MIIAQFRASIATRRSWLDDSAGSELCATAALCCAWGVIGPVGGCAVLALESIACLSAGTSASNAIIATSRRSRVGASTSSNTDAAQLAAGTPGSPVAIDLSVGDRQKADEDC